MKHAVELRQVERALLVIVMFRGEDDDWLVEDETTELRDLALATGVEVVHEVVANRERPTAGYYVGTGKVEELAALCVQYDVDVVIFNRDLSPAQIRNLFKTLKKKTIDRTQLILDIFAQRARSLEGKLQVELAQLRYRLPRLAGLGKVLSQTGGGVGTRGPGEKMLETDRRHLSRRILRLEEELQHVAKHRTAIRRGRQEAQVVGVALVGYTNAGKSTLFNRLTEDTQVVMDQLFSTLDPVSRRLVLPNHQTLLLYDTVGFLHRLPHHLIEAFHATLEEVVEADVLLHVVNAPHPLMGQHVAAVEQVLNELEALQKPMITVLNKVDRLDEPSRAAFARRFPDAVQVSALTGEGMDRLHQRLIACSSAAMVLIRVQIPMAHAKLVHVLHEHGKVREERYETDGVLVEALVPHSLHRQMVAVLGPSAVSTL